MTALNQEQQSSIRAIYESRGFTVEFMAEHVALSKGGKVSKLPNTMFLVNPKKEPPGKSPD